MRRFSVLDSFRGLCAVAIVFYHMQNYNVVTDNAFVNNCDMFVNFFFVLSGFVIAYVYLEKINSPAAFWGFLRQRFWRIYPLHLYTLLVFAAFELCKWYLYKHGYFPDLAPSNNNIRSFLSSLFLLNATPIGTNDALSWNYPSWSISAEAIAYLFFAIVVFILRKHRYIKYAGLLLMPLLVWVIARGRYFLFFDGIRGFFAGVVVHEIYRRVRITALYDYKIANILEVLLLLLTMAMVCYRNKYNNLLVSILVFSADIYVYSFETGWISQVLKNRIFQSMGRYSYSIYLNNAIVIELLHFLVVRLFGIHGWFLYVFPFLIVLVTILYSRLTYNFVEMKFYRPSKAAK